MTQSSAIWKSSFSDCIISLPIKLSGPTVFFLCERSLFILDSNSLKHYLGFTSLLEPNFVQDALFFSVSQVALLVKNPSANAGDVKNAGSIPGSGRSPGGGHGNPLQYSCLENPGGRGAWRATVHTFAESRTGLKRLSVHAHFSRNLSICSHPSFWAGSRLQYLQWLVCSFLLVFLTFPPPPPTPSVSLPFLG